MYLAPRGISRLALAFYLLGALALAGCGNLGVMTRIKPVSLARYDEPRCIAPHTVRDGKGHGHGRAMQASNSAKGADTIAIDLDCFTFPEQHLRGQTAYAAATVDATARNRLAAILMIQSDSQCTRESGEIVAREAALNGGLSTAATALGTIGGLVSGEAAAHALSAASGLFSATRDHLNAAIYRNQLTQGITAAIAGDRARQRAAILARLALPVVQYPVDQMIRDVNEYHQTCSFYKGIELLVISAEQYPKLAASVDRDKARADIDQLQTLIARLRTQGVHTKAQQDGLAAAETRLNQKIAQAFADDPVATKP